MFNSYSKVPKLNQTSRTFTLKIFTQPALGQAEWKSTSWFVFLIPVDLTSCVTGGMPRENRECLRAFTCHLQDWMSRYTDIHWEKKHTQVNFHKIVFLQKPLRKRFLNKPLKLRRQKIYLQKKRFFAYVMSILFHFCLLTTNAKWSEEASNKFAHLKKEKHSPFPA